MIITDFLCWVAVIALLAAFALSLAVKWKILEWLQVHSPTEWLNKLFSCKFCCSWWTCLIISVPLCVLVGNWLMLLAPVCATIIARELW